MPSTLTQQELDTLAASIVNKLVLALSDEETSNKIVNVWGKHLDRMLGRGIRRLGGVLVIFLLGIASIKFDVFAKAFLTNN